MRLLFSTAFGQPRRMKRARTPAPGERRASFRTPCGGGGPGWGSRRTKSKKDRRAL